MSERTGLAAPGLATADLHGSLEDPQLTSMNFLNEIAERYPDAVSFAAGRPTERFFDVDAIHDHLTRYRAYLSGERGFAEEQVRRTLCQYGRTKGIVHELVARTLAVDEGIDADPEAVVVTVGCQEAMFLVLRALRATERDVLLAVAPTYVGLTGAARLVDMAVLPVASGPEGVDLADLTATIRAARAAGLRPRACYVMPDFANPSGVRMDLATRRALLDVAVQEDVLLLEDNPYGLFTGEARALPTLKRLDTGGQVVYLGSFAKTVLPGARVGYLVADQRVRTADGRVTLLADELSKIKSMLTVNTSPIAQAVVGGALLAHGGSLRAANERQIAAYADNRRTLLSGLARRFADVGGVSWNAPSGGYFAVVTVPFEAGAAALARSAARYGVLWTPMTWFYADGGGAHQLRLSVSSLDGDTIENGLDRLYVFITECAEVDTEGAERSQSR
jgi:(S)-3,5-dihydroxyphenylglycine transaminase